MPSSSIARKHHSRVIRERTEGDRAKTGVFTGSYAVNPVNGELIPVWVADYVLAGYGTGAIMAVPAHDDRDFEFAKQFDLKVIPVVEPPADHPQRAEILAGDVCFVARGKATNSKEFDGMQTDEVKAAVVQSLIEKGQGSEAVNYKLRDWLFSRQRFWGEPFPILHEVDDAGNPTGRKRGVPVEDLPVRLPELEDFKPHGRPEPPLAKAADDWLYVTIDGKRYPPRDQHHASVGGIVLVLLALHRSKESGINGGSKQGESVDARRSLCRRC